MSELVKLGYIMVWPGGGWARTTVSTHFTPRAPRAHPFDTGADRCVAARRLYVLQLL